MSEGIGILHAQTYKIVRNAYDNDINIHLDSMMSDSLYDSITFLIGIGCVKCGTSSFLYRLRQSTKILNNLYKSDTNYDYYWYTSNWELHYFEECPKYLRESNFKRCSFDQYLNSFRINIENTMRETHRSKLILSEKTTSYYCRPGSAYYLTLYAHIYKIKFYLLLRNPIKRFWSNIWMEESAKCVYYKPFLKCSFWDESYHLNSSSIKDEHIMSDRLMLEMSFYSKRYPSSYKLLQKIKTKPDDINNNDDINEDEIVELYIKAMYEHFIFHYSLYNNPILSCYYPMILMWNKYWNQWNNHPKFEHFKQNGLQLSNNLRIIQTEEIFDIDKRSKVIQELMCWTVGDREYEMNLTKCKVEHNMLDTMESKMKDQKTIKSQSHFAASEIDVMDLEIGSYLKDFYADCNQRLYWYIEKHPDFMLARHNFKKWW